MLGQKDLLYSEIVATLCSMIMLCFQIATLKPVEREEPRM